ncbi:hypothetical protein M0805_004244 [Coniferiporia weirii]|nr:hypothetical protein M0805_004244 [Coniferiporia weirii]
MAQQSPTSEQSQRRPPHLSVASIGTNASGVADSTISYASDFTVSQFPVPPTEALTPTLSNLGTPTTPVFTERRSPSIPDYASPSRFAFGKAPTCPPPTGPLVLDTSLTQASRARVPEAAQKSTGPRLVNRPAIPPVHSLDLQVRQRGPPSTPSPSTTSISTPVYPTVYRRDASHPPTSGRILQKRPETLYSLAGESSMLDWSDAASGISVNPSEERLLSTSFITSLLSQSPEPFPGKRTAYSSGRLAHAYEDGRGESRPQNSRSAAVLRGATTHERDPDIASYHSFQSRSAPKVPSDAYSFESSTITHSTRKTDAGSPNADFRHTPADYPESLHSNDEQLHSVIRIPSLSFPHGGSGVRPVGVVPACQVSYGTQRQHFGGGASNTARINATSIPSKPPGHHADTPQNVRQASRYTSGGVPRTSEEDFVRMDNMEFDMSRLEPLNSPALPSTAGIHNKFADVDPYPSGSSLRYSLQRNRSVKSVVSSIVSRISTNSTARKAKYLSWLNKRPLPPLPHIVNPPPEFPNGRDIQKMEEDIPLPVLVKRAEDLQGMLSNGRFPVGSVKENEFHYNEGFRQEATVRANDHDAYLQISGNSGIADKHPSLFSRFRGKGKSNPPVMQLSSNVKFSIAGQRQRKLRLWAIAVCIFIGIVLVIAIPIGVTSRGNRHSPLLCNGNLTGSACTLDATCECTINTGTCKPLAQSLFLLVSDVNSLFAANFTPSDLSDAVVGVVGPSTEGLCKKQALLVDVEPGLDGASAPNRTKWAQAAILWNLGLSEDVNATTSLRNFVSTAPWDTLAITDGPVTDSIQEFAFNASGYTFDFASQTLSPIATTFEAEANPSDAQLAEVSEIAGKVLDRMYSFAAASSNQRQKSLINYWTSVLQQQQSDLAVFIEAVQNSLFLLPFDATSSPGGTALTGLMSNISTTPFPPPIACYPGLNATQVARINTLEESVFGLSPASSPPKFSTSCFPDRPIYGVIDLLRLRLPFPDKRTGVALQASALSRDATIRTVIYSGEVLSALPGATALPSIDAAMTDPREFGTASSLNHVLLNYLSSISNITLAMDLVSYVLSSAGPPASNSDLFASLLSLPTLEFAMFGSITPQDIASSVSSFSTQSDSLFFGSGAGETFRSWALVNTSATIAWTESATSSEIVRESAAISSAFESVWKPASELVAAGATDASDVQKVTSSLSSLGLFSST